MALVVSAGLAAGLAWVLAVLKGHRARAVAWGGVPLGIASVASLLWALWRSAMGLDAVWTGQGTGTEWQRYFTTEHQNHRHRQRHLNRHTHLFRRHHRHQQIHLQSHLLQKYSHQRRQP